MTQLQEILDYYTNEIVKLNKVIQLQENILNQPVEENTPSWKDCFDKMKLVLFSPEDFLEKDKAESVKEIPYDLRKTIIRTINERV